MFRWLLLFVWFFTLDFAFAAKQLGEWELACYGTDEAHTGSFCVAEMRLTPYKRGEEPFVLYFARQLRKGRYSLVVIGPELPFARARVKTPKKNWVESKDCGLGQCVFSHKSSVALLRLFRRGKKAQVQVYTLEDRLILDQEITLLGFNAAMDMPRPRAR